MIRQIRTYGGKIKLTGLISTLLALSCLGFVGLVFADSTSVRLAAYYDLKMLLCADIAYRWWGTNSPEPLAEDIIQVGVGRDVAYGLHKSGQLLAWQEDRTMPRAILASVKWFTAGRSGVFAIRVDNSLWFLERSNKWIGIGEMTKPVRVAKAAVTASVGDSANYFITADGRLHVKGLAHRGQYGDGKLRSSDRFVTVANNVRAIRAHTGHAILLNNSGSVMGTGGNIYGPLGRHGLGDKAVRWGVIFGQAKAIATGSSHSLALKADGSLWHWGRNIGLDGKQVLSKVIAAAADTTSSIALTTDQQLWQWERGEKPAPIFRCP